MNAHKDVTSTAKRTTSSLRLCTRYLGFYLQSAFLVLLLAAATPDIPFTAVIIYAALACSVQLGFIIGIRLGWLPTIRNALFVWQQALVNSALQIVFMFVVPPLFYYFVGSLFVICVYAATRLTRRELAILLTLALGGIAAAVQLAPISGLPVDTLAQKVLSVFSAGLLLWRTTEIVMEISLVRRQLDDTTDRLSQLIRVLFEKDEELRQHREHLESLVTDRTAELQEAKEVAEAAVDAKTQFLANVSHELRTPLNGILGAGEVLQSELPPGEEKELAEVVVSSGQSLLRLVNDLLDYATMEASGVEIRLAPFNLQELLLNIVAMAAHEADAKGVPVQMDWPNAVDADVIGDGGRIRQIIANVLNNAIRFTDSGVIKLSVTAPVEGSRVWQLRVSDTGVGMREDHIERAFEAFSQVGEAARRKQGTGLGLAISRQLAERMGGSLTASSELNVGTHVTLTMPLPAMEAQMIKLPTGAASIRPLQGRPAVLLVEDNRANQVVTTRMLSLLCCEAAIASSGDEALEMLAKQRFDVALIDRQMPGMDGIELTRRIRGSGNGMAAMPIIAVTADALESERQRCLAAGMDDFLSKPYTIAAMQAKLHYWVRGQAKAVQT